MWFVVVVSSSGQIPVVLKHDLMFFEVNELSKVWDGHSYRVTFSIFLPLLSRVQKLLICLNADLKGLKQLIQWLQGMGGIAR